MKNFLIISILFFFTITLNFSFTRSEDSNNDSENNKKILLDLSPINKHRVLLPSIDDEETEKIIRYKAQAYLICSV